MTQEKSPQGVAAPIGGGEVLESPHQDYTTLLGAQAALRRFYRQAEHSNHDGLLDAYLVQLGEELVMVGDRIRRAELEALDAWRKAEGHAYMTQVEAYDQARERHQERMRERYEREVG